MRIGYKLATEGFGPKEIIRQAVLAEQAGFDFVEMSDHYHPWVEAQGHSAFTWSLLSAIAVTTDRIGLATGVTCPSVRYHPAIIARPRRPWPSSPTAGSPSAPVPENGSTST
jgi:G6PDH family F420-dependent oxidoreductase